MKPQNISRLLLLLVMTFVGCDKSEPQPVAVRMLSYSDLGPSPSIAPASRKPESLPSPTVYAERMVIKTATLRIEVLSIDSAMTSTIAVAESLNGFVVQSTIERHGYPPRTGNLTMRVPHRRFYSALDALKKIASRVESEAIRGNDVTEEFYDITARLENKRKAEKRYQEILKVARTTKEVLEVEQTLTSVRQEIESLEGRKKHLSDQSAFSTIDVHMSEPRPLVAAGTRGPAAKLTQGVERGVSGMIEVLSYATTFFIAASPIGLVTVVSVILVVRLLRRRANREMSSAE